MVVVVFFCLCLCLCCGVMELWYVVLEVGECIGVNNSIMTAVLSVCMQICKCYM